MDGARAAPPPAMDSELLPGLQDDDALLEAASAASDDAEPDAGVRPPRRILIVDDDTATRMLMAVALSNAGFEVETAGNGDEGLEKFRRHRCDMVLLDVDMPGKSGHEVCAELRAEVGDLLPIVMVTGMDDVESVERAYHAGATDFFAKPINWALIGHRVRYLYRGFQNLMELQAAERKIRQLAYYDNLTGLPNRQSFLERVEREIARARQSGTRLAVLFMDLDGFKNINDTLGHGSGDLVLQWVADRLREELRPSDLAARSSDGDVEVGFARLGGDEFTALMRDIGKPEDALVIAHRIRDAMRRPFRLDKRDIAVTTSIGVALYPNDGEDALTLLKHADTAMYHAKDRGRDNCQLYSASLTAQAMQRMMLESNLRLALARNEFHLLYQPQFDLQRGSVVAVEALLRWQHPEHGLIQPLDFIPLAEENGLIVPIGEWVLRTACADAAGWQRAGHELRVAVNLSPMQFRNPNLINTILDTLAQTGLEPARLEIEVTESTVMEASGIATLQALCEAGVRVALDDFGTGYSSMSYLRNMPLTTLKVDRCFVAALPGENKDRAIVRAILSLAKSLDFSVTAEGVETIEQAQELNAMACDALQGHLFSKPVPADDIPALLARDWVLDRRS
jgi:diguanylate cyclase (GGDEF)-like protein